jgi:hypothetical protein
MAAEKMSEAQNSKSSIEFLCAASHYYGRAKIVLALQFVLTVPGAIALALVLAARPELKIWGVLYSMLVALADSLWLDRWQAALRVRGAKAQEAFDAGLFGFDWRKWQVGARLTHEEILSAARKFRGKESHLKDWYPASLDSVPLPLRGIVCQRINAWWDSELRRRVAWWLIGTLLGVVVAVLVVSVASSQQADRVILTIIAPLFPAINWSVREALRQFDAARKLDSTKLALVEAWESAVATGKMDAAKMNEFQAAIYDGRSRHPLIFDWIHRRFRPEGQVTMQEMADRLVIEATKPT